MSVSIRYTYCCDCCGFEVSGTRSDHPSGWIHRDESEYHLIRGMSDIELLCSGCNDFFNTLVKEAIAVKKSMRSRDNSPDVLTAFNMITGNVISMTQE